VRAVNSPRIAWNSIVLVLFCVVNLGASAATPERVTTASTFRPFFLAADDVLCALQFEAQGDQCERQIFKDVGETCSEIPLSCIASEWSVSFITSIRPAAHLLEQAALYIRAP